MIVNDPEYGLPLTPHSAIRRGDMKLIWDWHGALQLYGIAHDPSEANNLAAQEPELANELFRQLTAWLDANVERKYFPRVNKNYQPELDTRPYAFQDLRGRD